MTLPNFLQPLSPVIPAAAAMAASPLGGGGPSLVLGMQTQAQTNWCWAATASSVSMFYNSASPWNQCAIASSCLGQTCCSAPVPLPCNVPYVLDIPLTTSGNLNGQPIASAWPFLNVQNEINAGRPIGCHIAWAGGGGHFVAISGYDASVGDVYVADPLSGPNGTTSIPYSSFVTSSSGSWDYTYLTQP